MLRLALQPLAAVSTRKGRLVMRLDPGFKGDLVVGVEATDGSENVCLATRAARVLIFPVTEANIVAGAARGVTAIRLDSKDRVLGFMLANKKREGLTVRTNRGGIQIVRATKYPVTGRGGKGYAILQRGSLDSVVPPRPSRCRAWRRLARRGQGGMERPRAWGEQRLTSGQKWLLIESDFTMIVTETTMSTGTYTAKSITVLEGLEAVRRRPGMYIGGVDKTGFHHLLWEIVDNAVDEVMNGHATRIVVTLQCRRQDDVGLGQRARHPGGCTPQEREERARGDLHDAACRRQV